MTLEDQVSRTPTRAALGGTAVLLIAGAVVVNVAFVGLGRVFDYPDVLGRPPDVLVRFHQNQWAVGALFQVLAASAALLAPIAIAMSRLGDSPALRMSRTVGIAAAVAQVAGLLRWPVIVPFLADESPDARAVEIFHALNVVLGTTIGETIGYALTATWTVLVCVGLRRVLLGRALTTLGLVAAALIAIGTVAPLGVPMAGLANFVGYVAWSAWLVAVALLIRRRSA